MPLLACPRFAQAAQPGVKGRNLIGTICSVPAAALEDDIVAPPGNVYLSGGCLVEDEAAASARTSASCSLQGVTFKVFTMSESQRRGSVSAILRTVWYSPTRPSTYTMCASLSSDLPNQSPWVQRVCHFERPAPRSSAPGIRAKMVSYIFQQNS